MRKLWREIFDAYEMPQDLVLEPREIVKEQVKFQKEQYKAQQSLQAQIASDQQ